MEEFVGVLIGAIIGLATSWWFARSSTKELRVTAQELKAATQEVERLTTITLRALEDSSAINALARREGEITGISHPATAVFGASGTLSASATVIKADGTVDE